MTDVKLIKKMLHWLGLGSIDEQLLQDKYFSQHSQYVEIDGIKMHYRVEGSGAPVVLVHGVLSSLHTWDDWVENLSKNFTVYRMDLPGFGFSTLPDDKEVYSEENITHTMYRFLEKLNLPGIHIVGNSLGGYIAWNYAHKYPEQVKSLTVVDPLCYHQKVPFLLRMPTFPLVGSMCRFMVPKAIFNIGVKQVYASPDSIAQSTKSRYFELLMRRGNKSNFVTVARALKRIAGHSDLGAKIKHITVPTLVMWGSSDHWIPVELAYRWQQDLPNATVETYPNCGHIPMEELANKSVQDLSVFLEKVESVS